MNKAGPSGCFSSLQFPFQYPEVRLSYDGHNRNTDYNCYVCFVRVRLFGAGCGDWNKFSCSKSRSCLFDGRLAALMCLIHRCVCLCVFAGIHGQFELGERRPPWAAAGNCGPLFEARPSGLERGGAHRPTNRSVRLLILWVHNYNLALLLLLTHVTPKMLKYFFAELDYKICVNRFKVNVFVNFQTVRKSLDYSLISWFWSCQGMNSNHSCTHSHVWAV